MGSGRFDSNDWKNYATASNYATKSTNQIFVSRSLDPDLDPRTAQLRESRDSNDNPESTAIIVAQDVTGSMGVISDTMARKGVPMLLEEIYSRKPVSDPHVLCMAVGDVETDSAPFQVTQFEADLRISKQLEKFYLEGNGGGNGSESYALAWWFASKRVVTDCFEKRGKKGYLFTIGDEQPTVRLTADKLRQFLDEKEAIDVDMDALLTEVTRRWEVFHLIVEQGSFAREHLQQTRSAWKNILGQRAVSLTDHTKLAETIVSIMEVNEGKDVDEVIGSWDGTTAVAVGSAIKSLASVTKNAGVVTL